MKHAAAYIILVPGQNPGFQSRGNGKWLKCGAWLVGIADAEIIPQFIQFFNLFIIRHCGEFFFRVIFRHIPWIVQVIIRIGGFCKDLSILRIHYDNRRILASLARSRLILVLIIKFQNVLFHDILHLEVNGRDHCAAVISLLDRTLEGGTIIQIPILSSIRSIEDGIIGCLDSIAAYVSIDGKADNIAGKRVVRIRPDIVFLQPDSLHIRIFLVILVYFLKFLCLGVIHAFLQYIISAGRALIHQFPHLVFFDSKTVLQHFNRRLDIILIAHHNLHIQDHVIDPFAGCHLRTVAVHDISPFKRNGPAVILLLIQNHLRVLVSAGCVDIGYSAN